MKKIILMLSILVIAMFNVTNVEAYEQTKSIIIDSADLYAENQKQVLYEKIEKIYDKYEIDVHVLTTHSLNQTAETYINNYVKDLYNTSQPNYDVDAVVILISLKAYSNTNQRWIEISNYGYASKLISNRNVDSLTSGFTSTVGTNNYYNSTSNLLDEVYDEIYSSILINNILPHILICGIALFISIMVVISLVYNRGTKRTVSNNTYMNRSSSKILGRYDRYMRTTVVRVPLQQSSSGSGGRSGGGGGSRGSGGGRGF